MQMTQGLTPRLAPAHRLHVWALALLCALALCAAQGCASGGYALNATLSTADATAAHDGLRALQKKMTDALNARDVDALMSGVHPQIVFAPMNGLLLKGQDAVRAYLNTTLAGPVPVITKLTVEMVPADLSILYGDRVAIAYGASTDTYTLATGKSFVAKTQWTATLLKLDGEWKIAAFQNGVGVFDDAVRDQFK